MTIENIIRPIVEGKLRTLVQEHPELLDCVLWYKVEGEDREDVFVNSAAKRIVNDLVSEATAERLRTVLCGSNQPERAVGAVPTAHHSGGAESVREGKTTSLPHVTAKDAASILSHYGLKLYKDINKTTNTGKTSEHLLAEAIMDLMERSMSENK